MRSEIIRRYIKFLPSLAIAIVFVAIISWAVIQKPVESQEIESLHGSQVPLYIPLPSYT